MKNEPDIPLMLHSSIDEGLQCIEEYYVEALEARTPIIAVCKCPFNKRGGLQAQLYTMLTYSRSKSSHEEFVVPVLFGRGFGLKSEWYLPSDREHHFACFL